MMLILFILTFVYSSQAGNSKKDKKAKKSPTYTFSHAVFDSLLQLNVRNGEPYYEGFDVPAFYTYCDSLSKRPYLTIPEKEQASFWLNAINSCVIRSVLMRLGMRSISNYPDFYTKDTFTICGIRKCIENFIDTFSILVPEPIHLFGVFKGGKSYPSLMNRAFHFATLRNALKTQARKFVRSEFGSVLDIRAKVLGISVFFQRFNRYGYNDALKMIRFIRQFLSEDAESFCIVEESTLKLNYLPENSTLIFRTSPTKVLKIKAYGE